jgi:hypothetical protein
MSDGIIDTTEDNQNTGHEYYKIVAIDGTKISLCEGEYLNMMYKVVQQRNNGYLQIKLMHKLFIIAYKNIILAFLSGNNLGILLKTMILKV